ncbi:DUF3105 domain-containing protein [Deinococcus sp.]|uniref:DUF3105 domain-containing protein n=1 Tax=Deinococcus sp. TaxID=47478 RepID=UPI0025E1CE8C|nr:DUF3105 domain-containing protein [Deinococcus sp.]
MSRLALLAPLLLLTACSNPLANVQTFAYVGGDVRSGTIGYERSPPAGGPYSPLWQTCGVYAAPIYPEYAVHSLARGAVWVTYRPDLSPGELSSLRGTAEGNAQVLLSPQRSQLAPVMVSAWNAQLALDGGRDARLKRFLGRYAGADTVPEAGQPCAGGFGGTQDAP